MGNGEEELDPDGQQNGRTILTGRSDKKRLAEDRVEFKIDFC